MARYKQFMPKTIKQKLHLGAKRRALPEPSSKSAESKSSTNQR